MSASLQEVASNIQVPARSALGLLQPPHPPLGHASSRGQAAACQVGPKQDCKPVPHPPAFCWPLRWAQNHPPENHPTVSSLDRKENPGGRGPLRGSLIPPLCLARAEPALGPDQAALGFVLAGLKTLQPLSVLPVRGHLQTFLQLLQATYSSLSLPPLALPFSTSPQCSSRTGELAHCC